MSTWFWIWSCCPCASQAASSSASGLRSRRAEGPRDRVVRKLAEAARVERISDQDEAAGDDGMRHALRDLGVSVVMERVDRDDRSNPRGDSSMISATRSSMPRFPFAARARDIDHARRQVDRGDLARRACSELARKHRCRSRYRGRGCEAESRPSGAERSARAQPGRWRRARRDPSNSARRARAEVGIVSGQRRTLLVFSADCHFSVNTYSCWASRRVRCACRLAAPDDARGPAPDHRQNDVVPSGFFRDATSLFHSPKSNIVARRPC